MRHFTTRIHRFTRVAAASLGMLLLLSAVSLAEGWNDVPKPTGGKVSATSSYVSYADGSVLYADGTYIYCNRSYATAAAAFDAFGDLIFADGTILYTDGSWQ